MPTIVCTRKTKVAAQLKSSRMLLALNHVYEGRDSAEGQRIEWLRVPRSTEVAPSLNSGVGFSSSRSRWRGGKFLSAISLDECLKSVLLSV